MGKERPILFSAPMVRAILAGQKTQTRRIVHTRHPLEMIGPRGTADDPESWGWFFDGPDHHGWAVLARGKREQFDNGMISIPSPYGEPGDRLWVRETHAPRYFDDGRPGYRADWSARAADAVPEPTWTPSIFMRRHDSRITLEVRDVRVERLQAITEADARAEGIGEALIPADEDGPVRVGYMFGPDDGKSVLATSAREAYAAGWDTINAKRAPWDSNPWVWVVDFCVQSGKRRGKAA